MRGNNHKILKKIAIKNFKLNKKRSIVTIIGILLSTSLITSIVTLVCSFQTSTIEYTKMNCGNYHHEFFNIPITKLNDIKNNKNIEQYFVTKNIGSNVLECNQNSSSVKLIGLSENAINKIGMNLIEGTIPQNKNEIILYENILQQKNLGIKIGSEVTLNYPNNLIEPLSENSIQKYKITGIARITNQNLKNQLIDDNSNDSIVFMYLEQPDFIDNINVYVRYKDLNKRMETLSEILELDNATLNELQSDNQRVFEQNILDNSTNKYEFLINSELIERETGEYLDQTSTMLYVISIIIIIIIIIVSVYCIKNIFNISITERIREYGLLLSIGATKKQIKYSLLYEACILGFISIPIGIFLGEFYIYIILKLIKQLLMKDLFRMELIFSTNYLVILISILLSIITIYFAERKAIKKASKISPLDAIRNSGDININLNNKNKSSKLIKKCFGIEGVIAYRNLKRNKKSYTPTIISIIISSAVCIAMVSFINYAFKITKLHYEKYKYNIYIFSDNYADLKRLTDDVYIKANEYELNRSDYGCIKNIEEHYSKEVNNLNFSNNYRSNTLLIEALGNEEYIRFINKLGLQYNDVKNKAILLDYKIDSIKVEEKIKNIEFRLYDYKKGDMIELEKDNHSIKIEIADITKEKPMGLSNSPMAYLVVSDNFFNQYTNTLNNDQVRLYINSNDGTNLEEYIKENYRTSYSYLGNIDKEKTNEKTMYTVISIFLYSFITIMICIGVTNIFNTITTFIELRQKEFACIKAIGMTKKQFSTMIRLESIFYSIKALSIGIPLGILLSYLIYKAFSINLITDYIFPLNGLIISIIAVYLLIISCSKFSINKINRQNIVETIRNDNI